MPKFHQFDGFQIDVRSKDHNPPHFHVISAEHHALIRIDNLMVMRGSISRKHLIEATAWAKNHKDALMAEWRRLNEGD